MDILCLNPSVGISGDMLLGALLDLGAPLDAIRDAIGSTGVTGWSIEPRSVERGGVRALHAVVTVDDVVSERHATELLDMAARAEPATAAKIATQAITALAEVEAHIHGLPLDRVHLHELGGIDTIVDTVGVAAALEALDITEVWSGALGLGAGTVTAGHGRIPVPAPATLALLKGTRVVGVDTDAETVTPTGAALLKAMGVQYGPVPAMTLKGTGYGAGARQTPGRPNVLTAVLGSSVGDGIAREDMVLVETTVDDVTGEVLGHLIGQLLGAGAADAWITSAIGKKNRPAHVVTALCTPAAVDSVEMLLTTSTGTLGLRRTSLTRGVLPRHWITVEARGRPVRVKKGPHGAKPEHDDLVALQELTGVPLPVLSREALTLADQSDLTDGRSRHPHGHLGRAHDC